MARYQILNAADTSLSLDVSNGSRRDGTNVLVWTANGSIAQQWEVTEVDGGYRILATFLGKSLDCPDNDPYDGQNLQVWSDNGSAAQIWEVEDTGDTATVDDEECPIVEIKLAGTDYMIECAGSTPTAGTNVQFWEDDGGLDQRWVLAPVSKVVSGGIYELAPMHNPKLRLDVMEMSNVNGTNVFAHPANGGNNQKFYVTDEGDGWSIRDISSGKYVDVDGAVFADGTNVQIWEDNDSRAQRWDLEMQGTTTVDGTECEIVSLGAGNESDYMLDVELYQTEVKIYADNGGTNQRWALVPTVAQDANMPVPSEVGLASSIGGAGSQVVPDGTWYATWRCSDAWATDGPNSYRYRLRTRYMDPDGSQWGDWGEWGEWSTAAARLDGTRAWLADSIDGNLDVDEYKAMQVQFQVASQGVGETENVSGMPADELLLVAYEPKVVIESATLTAEGLELAYTSDYPYGAMSVYLESLSFDGTDALASKATFRLAEDEGTFTVPFGSLKALPSEGDVASLTFYEGSDVAARFTTLHSASPTVSIASGTVDVDVEFEDSDALTERAVPDKSGCRVFLQTDSGLFELEEPFDVPYPFGSEYTVVTVYENGDDWGIDVTERPVKAGKRAHALTWEGGGVVVWLREGEALTESRTVTARHSEANLMGRAHSTVDFMGQTAVKGSFEGAVDITGLTDPYGTTRYTLEHAVEVGKCLYRSPFGRVAKVAVTGYSLTVRRGWAEVSVDYIEETR